MAKQAAGTVAGAGPAGTLAHGTAEIHHHGKPMSWVAVTVIIIGFLIGGIAMVPHPTWWAFWLGAGIAIVGCMMTLFARTVSDDWY